MKTIGMLGGMSWESTCHYYQHLNKLVNTELGGLHCAKIAMVNVDFDEIAALQHQSDWQATADILIKHAQCVEAAGADFLLICTNTMHKVADDISQAISIPLLHIADATGAALNADKIENVGLLATRFTMEEDFYKARLQNAFGINVIIPDEKDRQTIHHVIYEELCHGIINESSRAAYLEIINSLVKQGAQAIILGCTEISMLVNNSHTEIPLYDTTLIHAQAAVKEALK